MVQRFVFKQMSDAKVVLQIGRDGAREGRRSPPLRSDAEDGVDELTLTDRIAFSDPADLAFADCMHCLVALNRSACTLRRTESEARRDPLLDKSMVLFDDIV